MHEFQGVPDAQDLGGQTLTTQGESIPTRVPRVAPAVCPSCKAALYEAAPLTMRSMLLYQLEAFSSAPPPGTRMHERGTETSVRELCRKILTAPDPLVLEDAELQKLTAAVEANGNDYRDWLLELQFDFLGSAVKVKEPVEKPAEAADGEAPDPPSAGAEEAAS